LGALGNGKVTNKDIWVFEPEYSLGKISVLLPRFQHYVSLSTNETLARLQKLLPVNIADIVSVSAPEFAWLTAFLNNVNQILRSHMEGKESVDAKNAGSR
jgi:hypothetical protein